MGKPASGPRQGLRKQYKESLHGDLPLGLHHGEWRIVHLRTRRPRRFGAQWRRYEPFGTKIGGVLPEKQPESGGRCVWRGLHDVLNFGRWRVDLWMGKRALLILRAAARKISLLSCFSRLWGRWGMGIIRTGTLQPQFNHSDPSQK